MSPRRYEVDLAKAVGIVAVVLIHSMRPFFSSDVSRVELWLASATQFAVPAFLAASGVLHASAERVPAALTRARLRRLLLPYLVASVLAELYRAAFDGRALGASAALEDVLLASAFGPFYYVLHAVLFVLAAPLLARLPRRALLAVTLVALAAQWVSWTFWLLPFFWLVRNPLHWLAFFLAGWWLRLQEAEVAPRLARSRATACLVFGAATAVALALAAAGGPVWRTGALGWLTVAFTLLLILAAGVRRETPHRTIRFLSDSTYTIYLFHLFFVYPVQRLVPAAPGAFDPLALGAPWLAGLAGPLVLAALGRTLLGGQRSRAWLGS
jgi:surface polysaccharide O-acyltransferase-like enzyme